MAGRLSAVLTLLSAPAMGLTALRPAIPRAFALMRYAGAVYLIYHGYWAWAAGDEQPSIGESMPSVERAPLQAFCIAFGAGMSNLKALLFVAAFLPQCNDAAAAY